MPKPYIFVYIFCLFLLAHCQQKNPLAQNEPALIQELEEIAELAELLENPIQEGRPNQNLAIPEVSRAADPKSPLIVLDIIKARSDVRDIKLRDLYTSVKYIPIRFIAPVDSVWNRNDEFDFLVTPNNIIASHFSYGIAQFDLYGNFMNQIVKNDFYYTTVPGKKFVMVTSDDNKNFKGAKGNAHAIGDLIYYQHHDVSEQKGMWMQYNATPGELSATMINQMENYESKPKGEQLNSFQINNFRGAVSGLGANNIFPINEEEWASSNAKFTSSKTGSFMVSTNLHGDTLTKFKDHDPLRNFTGGTFRGIDGGGSQYSFLGTQHIRQGYNDTIYTFASSNKLCPKYVLNFGSSGIESPLEGMDPNFNLSDKFVIDELIETNKYLFIIYTQDYPCPNTAKKGTLFYNACIYDKAKRELYHIYLDQAPFVPEGSSWPRPPLGFLNNNFDKGPDFWPKRSTHDGMPFAWFKGLDLKAILNTISWEGNAPLKHEIEKMNDTDYLLMIAQ